MFSATQEQILSTNLLDNYAEAIHLLLYCNDSEKLNEALKFTCSASLRRRSPVIALNIDILLSFPLEDIELQKKYIHQLLAKVDQGTLIVKNIDHASPEIQHWFKYLMEYSRHLKDSTNTITNGGIPIFRGRFIFTAETSDLLSHQFLTWVNCAIVVDDQPGTELQIIEAQ